MTAARRGLPAAPGAVRWALLFGNFVIGCGVMVVPGTLNDLAHVAARSRSRSAGQLIASPRRWCASARRCSPAGSPASTGAACSRSLALVCRRPRRSAR